ncbi:AbrB family transcriptional regulator [Peribacillus saganii]|uniref:AbrB family transcriptional regulator n=1 Tax=Peribacillus saganii TaxID=2303992 RepID=A0A372LMG3_9BACI|nr:AbrB family transcriptional regulator [Peribacillus saganii]RFU67536.1 AbrB family transcriptional regulator [Peribacillus saganii]
MEKFDIESKSVRIIYTFLLACAGGLVFTFLQLPVAWLLGSLVAVFFGSRVTKIAPYWPRYLRDAGLLIVGYTLGLSFTKEAVIQIMTQLPSIFTVTVLLILFCAGLAFIVSRLSGIDYPTILTGSIPGGLSQMIMLAEEMKGINTTVVAFLQVTRLLMVIFLIPFMIFSPFIGGNKELVLETAVFDYSHSGYSIVLFAVVSILGAFAGKKVKLPTPFLLGPLAGTAILVLSGVEPIPLPNSILSLSQLIIGSYVGLLLIPDKLDRKWRFSGLSILSGVILIMASMVMSFILHKVYGMALTTSFLSVAPGGMDQMGLIAHEVQADLTVVTGYQVFRLFFIYFAVPPLLRILFKKFIKKGTSPL